jgi:Ricin-type beta-trefoil lectin domain
MLSIHDPIADHDNGAFLSSDRSGRIASTVILSCLAKRFDNARAATSESAKCLSCTSKAYKMAICTREEYMRYISVALAFVLSGLLLSLPISSWAQTPDPNFYYRLSSQFRGSEMSLDVFNDGPKNNLTGLERLQDVSGQYWKFLPTGDGSYRLITMLRGTSMCLDIFNGGPNDNQPHLAPCANVSGQFWNIRKEGSWVRFTTKFRGEGMCLDIFNGGPNDNQPHLAPCANVSGQNWLLSQTDKR